METANPLSLKDLLPQRVGSLFEAVLCGLAYIERSATNMQGLLLVDFPWKKKEERYKESGKDQADSHSRKCRY